MNQGYCCKPDQFKFYYTGQVSIDGSCVTKHYFITEKSTFAYEDICDYVCTSLVELSCLTETVWPWSPNCLLQASVNIW